MSPLWEPYEFIWIIKISALAGSSGGVDEQHKSESEFIAILRHACDLAMNFKRGDWRGNYDCG